MKKALIIGSGFGGLALAPLLADQGYEVTVLEKNESPGGRSTSLQLNGFTFDMGPSWYLMPDIFERYFEEFKAKPTDYYALTKLDPNYRIIYSRHEHIDIHADLERNTEQFERLEPGSMVQVKKLLELSKQNYEIAVNQFIYKNYNSLLDFLDPKTALKAYKLNLFTSLDAYMKRFVKNDKLRKILEYNSVFLGGSPSNLPALYSIMAHVDFNLGVWYPKGGMIQVVNALVALGTQRRVHYHYNKPVDKIVVQNGKVTGVQAGSQTYNADIVISNADYHFTESQLLEVQYRSYTEQYWQKRVLAPSAFILYLGIKGKVAGLKHHTLFFANDWEKHFNEIFDDPQWPDKPSYYVCAPSKTDPTVAPSGHENLFVLVPIASGIEDTPQIREAFAKKILDHLEDITGEDITKRLVVKKILSLNDYTELYNSYQGSALGLAHTLWQSAFFRPSNVSKKVSGLYYVGQYTTPGIGVPMCLISAQILRDRITSEHEA